MPAERLARAAPAAHELSEALWDAVREELADPHPRLIAELSEQLSAVAGALAALARRELGRDGRGDGPTASTARAASVASPPASAAAQSRPGTVLVDEIAEPADVEIYAARSHRRAVTQVEQPG
jgi:hypothetical protein